MSPRSRTHVAQTAMEKLQEDDWLLTEFRALLSGLLAGKLKADPLPVSPKHWWVLSYPRATQLLPPAPPSLGTNCFISWT